MSHSSTTYRTIESASIAEFKDRGSRFIAYSYSIATVEEVKPILNKLKDEHTKAVHFCYAFRIGQDNNLYRAADDGEPAGSAGRPILGQIDSFGLSNILIVVVRYFGGTLLGVPGLIHAYKTAAHDAIEEASIIEKKIERSFNLQFNYTLMNEVMRILKQYQLVPKNTEMGLFCTLKLAIPIDSINEVIQKLQGLREVEIINE